MSGIAAIIHFDGRPADPGEIRRMTASMAHRGADGIGHWNMGQAALGQCMLRTTPESLEEQQPWANEDQSLILVMDGRVDNRQELRLELIRRGTQLRNRSDAELVLRAYLQWGEACLHHIDGDFAFVIWDARTRRAYCARDRMGIKPLHYHHTATSLAVASDLHAILSLPWIPRTLNWSSLAEYAADEWQSLTSTVWAGVERLNAAHWICFSETGQKSERYWTPEQIPELRFSSTADYVQRYRELLFDSVGRLSRSHQPVAYEVSGGLDSSSVFAAAASLNRQGRLPAPRIEGFTLCFPGDTRADELEYARAVKGHLSQPIHETEPVIPSTSWHREWAARYLECPPFPNWTMGLGLYELAARRGARVVVTGLGGDEWLDGCLERYGEELRAGRWGELLACARADIRDRGTAWFVRQMLKLVAHDSLIAAHRWWQARSHSPSRPDILTTAARAELMTRRTAGRKLRRKSEKLGFLLDPYIRRAGEWSERQLSHSGLEIRNPYRSKGVLEFAFAVPERLLCVGSTDRWLHRQAISGLLPEPVQQRRSKAEFSGVYRRALAGLPEDFVVRAGNSLAGLVDPAGLAALYQAVAMDDPGQILPIGFQVWGVFGCMCLVEALDRRESEGVLRPGPE